MQDILKDIINIPSLTPCEKPQEITVNYNGGKDGLSAYQSAVLGGYTGTEAEFYAELAAINPEGDDAVFPSEVFQ